MSITSNVGRWLLGAILLVDVAGCGATKTYQLSWTLDGAAVNGPLDCSSSGIDAIEVLARTGGDETRSVFACYSELDGASAEGPDLSSGAHALAVSTLSPAGQRLTGPIVVDALIPNEGVVAVKVDLPRPPACADGVDNDGDGTVDLLDTNCVDVTDTSEGS